MSRHSARFKSTWARTLTWLCNNGFMRCAVCGTDKNLTKDHIVPRCYGGSNEQNNIAILCAGCNCRKDNKYWDLKPFTWPLEYVEEVSVGDLQIGDWLLAGRIRSIKEHFAGANGQYKEFFLEDGNLLSKGNRGSVSLNKSTTAFKLRPIAISKLHKNHIPEFSH